MRRFISRVVSPAVLCLVAGAVNRPRDREGRPKTMARRPPSPGAVPPEVTRPRGRPLRVGRVVRLPDGVASWEQFSALPPEAIRQRNLFPLGFRPLSHPLQ